MIVLICGGRNYNNKEEVFENLDRILNPNNCPLPPPDLKVISGKATGADTLAIDWAVINWVDFEEYPAKWKKYGRAAGIIRNKQMIIEGNPDLIIAFPGGKGTKNMIEQGKNNNIKVIKVERLENR